MRIAIDLNGVLRDTIGKLKLVYEKHLIDPNNLDSDEPIKTYNLNGSGETELVVSNELDFNYKIIEPITSLNLQEFFLFPTENEFYNFIYEEFPMQIFGHAGSIEMTSFNDFNNFYLENREQHEIIIVSDEIGKSKPATFFFLSKFGCLTESVKFYNKSTINSLWNEFDILLTANPELLLNNPEGKTVIKFNTVYNQNIICELNINTFKELNSIIENNIKC